MHTTLTTAWRSPSNIAIIKYWGKQGDQLPANPSLSITLSQAYTETEVTARKVVGGETPELIFLFEGKPSPAFAERIGKYISRLAAYVPFVQEYHLAITSHNSFPHSSGIASSASAMSALALCLAELQLIIDGRTPDVHFKRQVSEMARIGSGSACRSLYGPVALWGKTAAVEGSSDTAAIAMHDVHPVFHTLRDSILIIDAAEKSVSSSAGHALMQHHQYRDARLAQVARHMDRLLPAMQHGDMATFGTIAEAEALALHALMMTSDPPYLLMRPNTLSVLEQIRAFRAASGIHVYFTLDAGPNVHVLYPDADHVHVNAWIDSTLLAYCEGGRVIHDHAGKGPESNVAT